MLNWHDLNKQEREQLASQFAVTCSGEMETTAEELNKVPASAWEDLERRRQVKNDLEAKRLKELADKEKHKLKAEKVEVKRKSSPKLGGKKRR